MIARAWVIPDAESEMVACEGNDTNSVTSCSTSGQGAYTILQGSSYATSQKEGNTLRLSEKNLTLLELGSTGITKQYP